MAVLRRIRKPVVCLGLQGDTVNICVDIKR